MTLPTKWGLTLIRFEAFWSKILGCSVCSSSIMPLNMLHTHTISQSQAPSSGFWKALALAMPRKVVFHSELSGDPQTLLQGDRDPMLTMQPDYLDCRPDPDPAGDLGKNTSAGSSAAQSQFSSLSWYYTSKICYILRNRSF